MLYSPTAATKENNSSQDYNFKLETDSCCNAGDSSEDSLSSSLLISLLVFLVCSSLLPFVHYPFILCGLQQQQPGNMLYISPIRLKT